MTNRLLTPRLSLARIVIVAVGLLLASAFLITTQARASTTPASSAAECSGIVHEHHFVPNPDDPNGIGTCVDGRAPTDGSGSPGGEEDATSDPASEEGTAGKPVLGLIPVPAGFPTEPNQIIASAVTVIIGIAGLIFFIMLLFGGLRYLTAGGDEKSTMAARQTLTNAFIGLIIVVASFLIAQILFAVFGLDALVNVI